MSEQENPTATEPETDVTATADVAAPAAVVWQTILDQLGPNSEMPDGTPFPMKLEPWPGGRWYRDLGNNAGHFWGHVQVFKPPFHPQPLLEICGPMFMSYAAASHLQYRLTPGTEGAGTHLQIIHRAMGQIPQEHREGVSKGWEYGLNQIKLKAEGVKAPKNGGR